jgi:hypothetical protein
VAVTLDSNDTVSYYINGVPSGSWSGSGLNFSLGTSINLGDNSNRRFDGILDEVEIWNRVLSPLEIMFYRSLSLVGNPNGLYAYYHFNEGAGTTTANSGAVTGATGTLVSSPVWTNLPIPLFQFLPLTNSLATSNMWEGPSAGADSIVMAVSPLSPSWTNTANASWLHLSMANQSGSGSTNIVFTFDQNTGSTRIGSLTIAGQTLTVTQAGATYVPLMLRDARENTGPSIPALVTSGVSKPGSIAVDAAGNIYIPEIFENLVNKWTAISNTLTPIVPSLTNPVAVAVDGAGNLYIAGLGSSSSYIERWDALTQTLTPVPVTGLEVPNSLALDGAGNLYIADSEAYVIYKYSPWSNTTTTVASGLTNAWAVAVDVAGNVYYAGYYFIGEKLAANGATIAMATNADPSAVISGMAVDPYGNVYYCQSIGYYFYRRNVLDGTIVDVSSLYGPLLHPHSMAIDSSGNIYLSDYGNGDEAGPSIEAAVHAFIDSASPILPGNGGTATWGLEPTSNLAADLLAPETGYYTTWLTVGVTNGTIGLSFSPNPTANSRSAPIYLRLTTGGDYDQEFSVTQLSSLINLSLTPSGTTQSTLSWSPTWSGLVLQETANLNAPNWINSPSGTNNPVNIALTGPNKFYRVKSQ